MHSCPVFFKNRFLLWASSQVSLLIESGRFCVAAATQNLPLSHQYVAQGHCKQSYSDV